MSSTYSPSLRIELIGAGEQAGTWNTTTNTNLGTLIESAIAGYIAVSVITANQALVALDGAPDQARNAVIGLTTSTGADFAIYAPPQEKQYIIWNTTAYVATIYNSTVQGNTTAAGAGVAIPAGRKLTVFSTGTDFYTIDVAVGSISGVIPVVNGGTGVTTSTGSGSVVLNTSPTLVTPALGTPTALVGTNITGTAAGLTAGTVTTNANLTGAVTSTGNATSLGSFTSANLAAALTDETGSGASVFATSPTLTTPTLNSPVLVTPALGTPTSATLTNATGLPIDGGTTGTLPVTRGGTGTTSTTFANLATNVTGTLPITNGGTGTTSTTFANLATNVTGTLPIANGGTGTTATTFVNLATNVTGTLPIANGGTNSTAVPTLGGVVYGTGSAQAVTTAGTSGQFLTSQGGAAPVWTTSVNITSGTSQNAAGASTVTFTGIPSTAKRIVVLVNNVSTTSSTFSALQIGSGTLATSNYAGVFTSLATGSTALAAGPTPAWYIYGAVSGVARTGQFVLSNYGGNLWIVTGIFSNNADTTYLVEGSLTLGGTLDRIALVTSNGTTFSGGSVNILYE